MQQLTQLDDRLLMAIGKAKKVTEAVDTKNYSKGNINPSTIPVDDGNTQYLNGNQVDPSKIKSTPNVVQNPTPNVNNGLQKLDEKMKMERLQKSKLPDHIKNSFMKKPPITSNNGMGYTQNDADRLRQLMGEETTTQPVFNENASHVQKPTSPSPQGNVLSELQQYGLKAMLKETITESINEIKEQIKEAEEEKYKEITDDAPIGIRIGDQIYICKVIKVKDVK